MKKIYDSLDIDVLRFAAEDVLTTSGEPEPCNPEKICLCHGADSGSCNCDIVLK